MALNPCLPLDMAGAASATQKPHGVCTDRMAFRSQKLHGGNQDSSEPCVCELLREERVFPHVQFDRALCCDHTF